MASALELSEEEWNNTLKTNLTGTWLVSKHVSLCMRNADMGGSIINISSIAGLNRGYLPGGPAYNCSKGAVNTLSKVFSLEYKLLKYYQQLKRTESYLC